MKTGIQILIWLMLVTTLSGRTRQPNIIFILTDDQGYGDLSCHGHPFLQTPNLDQLHAESTRFTDFHASPTCAPSRAALMTGRAAFKSGVTHTILERDRLSLEATTIAEVLKSAGYTTGIFGKWHLGDEDAYQPNNRGFDETFIHGAGGIGQRYPGSQSDAPGTGYFNPIIKHNNTFVKTKGYCTDVFFQQALGWIRQNTSTDSAEAKPFFAYLATNAPHSPNIVAEAYQQPFLDKTVKKEDAAFFGMIVNIDENIGRLMDKLEEWDLADDTVLIFMTDNGTARGKDYFNAGMTGAKGSINEGGSRVPLFIRWPAEIQPDVDIDRLTRHVDLFPTLAELAGARIPDQLQLDGRSLLPLIHDPDCSWEDRYSFFHKGRWNKAGARGRWGKGNTDPDKAKFKDFAVRSEQWRLVEPNALYDIKEDPGETNNLIDAYPEVASDMLNAYKQWWHEVRELMINEDATLDTPKPFMVQFEQQKMEQGIPDWQPPEIGSLDSDVE
jgi:arylsulfatase